MDDNIKTNLITFAVTALLTWLVKTAYDKVLKVRPRLYISTKRVLYSQRNNHYQNFIFTWVCPILIKNNSKYTAERIEFISSENYNFLSEGINGLLDTNNHLEGYKEIELNPQFNKIVPYEDVVETYTEADGTRVSLPGTKMSEPSEFFKPQSLVDITIVIKYISESNKTFYTLYKKRDRKETNKTFLFNPLKWKCLVNFN